MSTYWYFECRDHSPVLRSADEFTHHTEDRWFWESIALANSRPVDPDDGAYWRTEFSDDTERSRLYFTMHARSFLALHPTCTIGIVNENGERRDLPTEAP